MGEYRRRCLKKTAAVLAVGIFTVLWKSQRGHRRSPDAWAATIPAHFIDKNSTREEQKEQMKKAFRLAAAEGDRKQDIFKAYQR
ncbi:hypothetical protein [Marinococcus luteus]|uniref:hypothetical protein n=1 Tax=Marinococcus luteus TaxID=1122204 RepID=UPI002ACEFF9B|nr:hypothetical protein [Marinococcus luteus]